MYSGLSSKESLIIFETLHPLATDSSINLPAFLSSFASVQTSLLATYHHDISISPTEFSPYTPSPLILLSYLATTIFKVHSLRQVLARKRAAQKSLAEPVFGLNEELEGVILGLGSNDPRGIVLEMEHRRKSGRAVGEWYFLPSNLTGGEHRKERMMLLDDHPLVKAPGDERNIMAEDIGDETTFSLGLTEKQKRDREGVLLPYFDAQKEGGGRGGRILYDMGVEDDFDEEEDEI
jgi:elongator complex protein 5